MDTKTEIVLEPLFITDRKEADDFYYGINMSGHIVIGLDVKREAPRWNHAISTRKVNRGLYRQQYRISAFGKEGTGEVKHYLHTNKNYRSGPLWLAWSGYPIFHCGEAAKIANHMAKRIGIKPYWSKRYIAKLYEDSVEMIRMHKKAAEDARRERNRRQVAA